MAREHQRQLALVELQAQLLQPRQQRVVQRGDAVVVEARGHRAEHRHFVRALGKVALVPLHLLADVAQRIERALAVELVDGDEVGKVQHVDLLELAGRAVLGRHHVQRGIDVRHDRRVALADAARLHQDEIEARALAGGNRVGQGLRDLRSRLARGERAHVNLGAALPGVDRVHADPVAEQRAAALAP